MASPDSNYPMQAAAEQAIRELRQQAADTLDAAARAEASAERAENTASRWKKLTIGAFVLVILVGALASWMFFGLRQQAVNSCRVGNDRATGTIVALDELVFLLEGPAPTDKVKQEAAAYEAYVAAHNQQRDCSSAYSLVP